MKTRAARLGMALAVAGGLLARLAEGAEEAPAGKLQAVVAEAEAKAREAGVSWQIALRAVENAMSARDEAEQKMMGALRAGDAERAESLKRTFRKAAREVEESRDATEEIGALAREAAGAARSATRLAEEAQTAGEADVAALTKKAQRLVQEAAAMAEKAAASTGGLKTRWLVHVVPPASSTNAAVVP